MKLLPAMKTLLSASAPLWIGMIMMSPSVANAQSTPAPTVDELPPTSSPTNPPTSPPTGSPVTPPPTRSPVKAELEEASATVIEAVSVPDSELVPNPIELKVEVKGELEVKVGCTVGGANPELTNGMVSTLGDTTCVGGDLSRCETTGTSTCAAGSRRGLLSRIRGRELQDLNDFTVVFTTVIKAYCQTNDCTDAADIVEGVADLVSDQLVEAVEDNSESFMQTFAEAVQEEAEEAGTAAALADLIAAVETAVVEAMLDPVVIPEAVATLIENIGSYYPDWNGGTQTCKNDGNAPLYMKRGGFIMSGLEECCTKYYSWEKTKCLQLGGASVAEFASDKFYVNYYKESCEQDCEEDTAGKNCGGLVPTWKTLFDSAEDCCETKLSWVEESTCQAESTLTPATAPAGSGKYYRKGNKCMKDCKTGTGNSECGGLAQNWDKPLFTSASNCCTERVWWEDVSDCLP